MYSLFATKSTNKLTKLDTSGQPKLLLSYRGSLCTGVYDFVLLSPNKTYTLRNKRDLFRPLFCTLYGPLCTRAVLDTLQSLLLCTEGLPWLHLISLYQQSWSSGRGGVIILTKLTFHFAWLHAESVDRRFIRVPLKIADKITNWGNLWNFLISWHLYYDYMRCVNNIIVHKYSFCFFLSLTNILFSSLVSFYC